MVTVYKTVNGSTVKRYDSGRTVIDFEWLDENACMDCEPDVDANFATLFWNCDICGRRDSAELKEERKSD